MDKAVPSSTEFQGGGLVLQTDIIRERDQFLRITLTATANVGMYPGTDEANPTPRYKERNFGYVDTPYNEGMRNWYQGYLANNGDKPLFVESSKGCELFVPSSSIVSVNLRTEYPSKWFLLWQRILRFKNVSLIVAAYVAHMVVLVQCH